MPCFPLKMMGSMRLAVIANLLILSYPASEGYLTTTTKAPMATPAGRRGTSSSQLRMIATLPEQVVPPGGKRRGPPGGAITGLNIPTHVDWPGRRNELDKATTKAQKEVVEHVKQFTETGASLTAWRNGFANCPLEVPPTALHCELPQDFPAGTYYRNGHGKFTANDGVSRVVHMLDADGLVVAITFDPASNKMLFRNRFVRTEGYLSDERTGQMSRRGFFGTPASGGWSKNVFNMKFKNPANTNVVYHGGKLHALWEVGLPYRIDPLSLETKIGKGRTGGDEMGGMLSQYRAYSAHPRYDPDSGMLVNFGNSFDPLTKKTTTSLYELDSDGKPTREDEVSFVFDGPGMMHDFCITENWHLFTLNFSRLDMNMALRAFLGLGSMMQSMHLEDNDAAGSSAAAWETFVVLVPRMKHLEHGTASKMDIVTDDRIKIIAMPGHFNFHFGNAFEDDGGNVLVFDTVEQDKSAFGSDLLEKAHFDQTPIWELPYFDHVHPSQLVRYTINTQFDCLTPGQKSKSVLSTRAPEFPTIPRELSTKRHRYTYAVGAHKELNTQDRARGTSGPTGAVMKIDAANPGLVESYQYQAHEFAGEVAFVPKVGANVSDPTEEDRGYVLHLVTNGRDQTTDLVVFDVEGPGSLERGPVFRTTLPTFIPHGIHGMFAEGVTFEF